MPKLKAGEIAEAVGGRLVGPDATASRLVADSRDVGQGSAFAAVRTGHSFVGEALEAGAAFVVVSRPDAVPAGDTAVVVSDTVDALGRIASFVRPQLRARVVGITGSTGKTLTKDFLAAALAVGFNVHAARSSYNNEIGVPLVLCGCPDYADVIVLELAARHRGEIAELCAMSRPEAGIVTRVGLAHLGEFGSRRAIAETKGELLESLPPDGVGVAGSDDDYLADFARRTKAPLLTVGPGGAVRYRADGIDRSGRTRGRVFVAGTEIDVALPVAGRALMRNAALAIALAVRWGIDPHDAGTAIADAKVTGSRMEIVSVGRWTVVNDAWNASPVSNASALRSTRELAGSAPKWAVLGQMAELGHAHDDAHRRVGRLAAALGYDGVIVLGEAAAVMSDGCGAIAHRVETQEQAAELVVDTVPAGSFVLVKGSRVTGLDRFPEILRLVTGRTPQEA